MKHLFHKKNTCSPKLKHLPSKDITVFSDTF